MIIYTIGYGNKSLSEVLAQIQIETESTGVIVDIRGVNSGGYTDEFKIHNLRLELEKRGIEYHWKGDNLGYKQLSIPSMGNPDIEYLNENRKQMFIQGCDFLYDLANTTKDNTIVLLCDKFNPFKCHRHLIIERMFSEIYPDVTFKHILWNSTKCSGLFI